MDVIDRIELLRKLEGLSRAELAVETGTKETRWQNVLKRQAKLYHEDLQAISARWPQYEVWINTGYEFPESGQISPLTAQAQKDLKTRPQVG